jgi:hypothetical protein
MKMKLFFIVMLIVIAAYEVISLYTKCDDTISEIVWMASIKPIVPFVAGMVAGHLFWNRNAKQ